MNGKLVTVKKTKSEHQDIVYTTNEINMEQDINNLIIEKKHS